jgi:predicted PurR-regulated permease PerM
MWLTMLGLIVGERVMGIPGLILAPVVLHFIKIEASQIEVTEPRPQSALEKK